MSCGKIDDEKGAVTTIRAGKIVSRQNRGGSFGIGVILFGGRKEMGVTFGDGEEFGDESFVGVVEIK